MLEGIHYYMSKKPVAAAFVFVSLAAAIFLYVSLFEFTNNNDIQLSLLPWLEYIIHNGRFSALGERFSNYNPPYLYLLSISSHLDGLVSRAAIIKIIPTFFVLLSGLFVYKVIKEIRQDSVVAIVGSIGFLFLPTVVLNSAFWGQADTIYTAFLIVFFYLVLVCRPALALVAFGIAVSIKLQAIFISPFLLFLIIRREVPWFYLVIVPIVCAAMLVPAAIAGRPITELATIYLDQADYYSRLSMNAPNPHHFIQAFTPNRYNTVVIISSAVAGLFAGWLIALSGLRLPEASARLKLLLVTYSAAVIPYLLAKMHDRYFFVADVFAYLLMFAFPRLWPVALGFQVSSTLAYSKFLFGFSMGPHLGAIINGVVLLSLTIYIVCEFGEEMGIPRIANILNRLTRHRGDDSVAACEQDVGNDCSADGYPPRPTM